VLRPAVEEHERLALPRLGDVEPRPVGQADVAVAHVYAGDGRQRGRGHGLGILGGASPG
jgi:hypothetical protein